MKKSDIVDHIAGKHGMSKVSVQGVIEEFMNVVQQSVMEGGEVQIRGFGRFFVKKRKAKMKKQFIKTQSGLHVPKSLQNQPLAIQQLLNFRGACSLISSGILADCDTKPVAGTETEIFLANREDIVDLDYNISNSMIVEGINMVALKKFYKFKTTAYKFFYSKF